MARTIFYIYLSLLHVLLTNAESDCSEFFPGKRPEPELQYNCVDPLRCPDGRSFGFKIIPEGTSKVLADLIKRAQDARCPEYRKICCSKKFIISEHPSVAMNEIDDSLLFQFPDKNQEIQNSSSKTIYDFSSVILFMSLSYTLII